jgi:hypothetical protein
VGGRWRPAAVAAAARGKRRGGCFAGQHMTLGGAIGPRECARELGLQRERPEEGVTGGGGNGRVEARWRAEGRRTAPK